MFYVVMDLFLEYSVLHYIAVLLVGIIGGGVGVITGGGGLIIISFLMLLGVPPMQAIATNRFGAIGYCAGSLYTFLPTGKIIWKYVPGFMLAALVGGYLGSTLVVQIDTEMLTKIIGGILIVFLPIMLMGKSWGVETKEPTKGGLFFGYMLYFLIMIFGGFFGGGAGFFIAYVLTTFFGLTLLKSKATSSVARSLVVASSLYVFIFQGLVEYSLGIVLFIGMFLGSKRGAKLALHKGNQRIKYAFAVVTGVVGISFLVL